MKDAILLMFSSWLFRQKQKGNHCDYRENEFHYAEASRLMKSSAVKSTPLVLATARREAQCAEGILNGFLFCQQYTVGTATPVISATASAPPKDLMICFVFILCVMHNSNSQVNAFCIIDYDNLTK